uniref:Uncharacterized protein n=1 Tax=Amorphochlora amoebiformis TaxID=1561963 RepID=A0A0H5BLH8_9EUKA|nr:hypothetical protein [Amorphochlora amoebiformis]
MSNHNSLIKIKKVNRLIGTQCVSLTNLQKSMKFLIIYSVKHKSRKNFMGYLNSKVQMSFEKQKIIRKNDKIIILDKLINQKSFKELNRKLVVMKKIKLYLELLISSANVKHSHKLFRVYFLLVRNHSAVMCLINYLLHIVCEMNKQLSTKH